MYGIYSIILFVNINSFKRSISVFKQSYVFNVPFKMSLTVTHKMKSLNTLLDGQNIE